MTHPDEYIDLQEDFNELLGWYREDQKKIILLQATADRRLALLKEIHSNIVYDDLTCPVCGDDGCSVDCRLAKELSDG